jgi:hypothetical protein
MRLRIVDCGLRIVVLLCTCATLGGCVGDPSNRGAVEPATHVDAATTQPAHWLEQPARKVASSDFDQLWSACEETARDFLFTLDRTDYRGGVLTTRPLTSRQWFEVWRPEVRTLDDFAESSVTTVRRTARFEFDRLDDGSFVVSPKVLVERQAVAERRITSSALYRGIFARVRDRDDRPRGTRESDVGVLLPARYWYPTARDPALEAALADSIRNKLARFASR